MPSTNLYVNGPSTNCYVNRPSTNLYVNMLLQFFTKSTCYFVLSCETHTTVKIILIFICICWCRYWASFTRNWHWITIIIIFVWYFLDISQNLPFCVQSVVFKFKFELGWSIDAIKYSFSDKTAWKWQSACWSVKLTFQTHNFWYEVTHVTWWLILQQSHCWCKWLHYL